MTDHEEYRFQVNLSGMIDILSNHLYSSPRVFLRELLQNATDAITARLEHDPSASGEVFVELAGSGSNATLLMQDNGIGLTEEDVHEFLAMIGHSSKRSGGELLGETSFIGRFGIGLLSCFMVSDEIVMLTQSAKGGPSIEWRGKPDGTYTIRRLDTSLTPGTKVYLRCKPETDFYFEPETVELDLLHYGALLPYPIRLSAEGSERRINPEPPEWIFRPELIRGRRGEVLRFGEKMLGERFRDYIPLRTSAGRTGGIAYILPHAVNLNAKRSHKVYLKRMLISEQADNILPEWAFFVKCLIWTDELQPTASREHFYENEQLERVRGELGESIRAELIAMSETDQDRLGRIIDLHALSMKNLAAEDDEFYRLIHRWLPFESTYGYKSLGGLLDERRTIYYTATLDHYRQLRHVASAQSMLVVNAGYIYEKELLDALHRILPGADIRRLLPEDVSLAFTDPDAGERAASLEAIRAADLALQRFRCRVMLKRFKPEELPALFTLPEEAATLRSIERAGEESPQAFASVLGSLGGSLQGGAYSILYLNLNNPVIGRLFAGAGRLAKRLDTLIEMLYANALMMGHYPMSRSELALLNTGILALIDWSMESEDKED
ncbi:HSP90 family protein [Saccharibacillus sp. CPCC 101409]|uniref:HSP90 family protein n=1 Tax=Saccharibacillus sp. CPCC 101409 TaxID=3058041 RepID=UPI002673CDD4|nr:HSP90 family protein [Saccharibacillus sp. CPCC 101409]MDO3410246.1 HSP90 family protein [Saccharibacillus sp. CPCC 101409]